MEKDHYIIGTRGSLLALTQCLQVKEELEAKSQKKFSLKIIRTQGDENTQAPLWQLEGKDFFTKELDQALLQGEVDLVVHSYKDLGSERPAGISLGAITKRKFSHDILFIRQDVVSQLQKKELTEIIIGTSSPRRITNIEAELNQVLPFGENLVVKTKMLRGNVNTRIEKLKDNQYHAIVLALPGIERLAQGLPQGDNPARQRHGDPKELLKTLLKDLNFMILPTSKFPAAASQGALGIESLEERKDVKEIIQLLNHQDTIEEVSKERECFQKYGGGCHLAVGITARKCPTGLRLSQKGKVDNRQIRDLQVLPGAHQKKGEVNNLKKVFIGLPKVDSFKKDLGADLTILCDEVFKKSSLEHQMKEGCDLFVSSPSALRYLKNDLPSHKSLWASGPKTMKELAQNGYWVNGSADSLGEEEAAQLRNSYVINLMRGEPQWLVLTNDSTKSSLGETLPLYTKEIHKNNLQDLSDCDFYYWSSPTQYLWFKKNASINPKALHGCGLGKTYSEVKKEENHLAFGSMEELKKFLSSKG